MVVGVVARGGGGVFLVAVFLFVLLAMLESQHFIQCVAPVVLFLFLRETRKKKKIPESTRQ